MKKRVNFRADGNSSIGLGHVIRSCALADILRSDFECHFYIRTPLPGLEEEIKKAGAQLHALPDETGYKQEAAAFAAMINRDDIVVMDGYSFDTAYQQVFRDKGCKLVCIDDIHAYHFIADAVINHSGGVPETEYSRESFTRLYLGPQYTLLRKPFLQHVKEKEQDLQNSLFICMGGADPKNDTLEVAKACIERDGIDKIMVVLGAGYRYREEFREFVHNHAAHKIEIYEQLDAAGMADLMRKARMAVTPPSTIAFEYLSQGGILYLRQIADNQENIRQYLVNEPLAFDFDEYPVRETTRINKLLAHQKEIFDGKSDVRLKQIFEQLV